MIGILKDASFLLQVPQVAEYIKEFHPEMVGLTGSEEKIKQVSVATQV